MHIWPSTRKGRFSILVAVMLVPLTLSTIADVSAASVGDWEPPARGAPPRLMSQADSPLQVALEALVREQGLEAHVSSGRLALGLVDITDLDAPRFAAVNPDRMMYAASLPKIAILLGAFVKIAAGQLVHDEQLEADMVAMIRRSDNPAANRVLDRVGREDLIEILLSAPLRLYDPAAGGGLWVGKDYAKGDAYRRDPLNNLSHGASVRQVARFFYLLERGELVGPRYDAEMKRILSQPEIRHKFVAGLASRPPAQLYRKSGTWRTHHADAALVEAGEYTYVIVGLARHSDGGDWLSRLAAPMHDLVVSRSISTSNMTD